MKRKVSPNYDLCDIPGHHPFFNEKGIQAPESILTENYKERFRHLVVCLGMMETSDVIPESNLQPIKDNLPWYPMSFLKYNIMQYLTGNEIVVFPCDEEEQLSMLRRCGIEIYRNMEPECSEEFPNDFKTFTIDAKYAVSCDCNGRCDDLYLKHHFERYNDCRLVFDGTYGACIMGIDDKKDEALITFYLLEEYEL